MFQRKHLSLIAGMGSFGLCLGQIRLVGLYYAVFIDVFKATKQQIATTFSICFFLFSATILATSMLQQFGARRTLFCGGLIASLGFALGSTADELWIMRLAYAMIEFCCGFGHYQNRGSKKYKDFCIGCGCCSVPCHVVLAHLYLGQSSFAFAMLQVGVSLGIIILAPFTQFTIETFGWRGSLLINSGLILHSCVFALFLDKPGNSDCLNQQKSIESRNSDTLQEQKSTTDQSKIEKTKNETLKESLSDHDLNSIQQFSSFRSKQSIWSPHPTNLPLIFLFALGALGCKTAFDQNTNAFAIERGVSAHESPWIFSLAAMLDSSCRLLMAAFYFYSTRFNQTDKTKMANEHINFNEEQSASHINNETSVLEDCLNPKTSSGLRSKSKLIMKLLNNPIRLVTFALTLYGVCVWATNFCDSFLTFAICVCSSAFGWSIFICSFASVTRTVFGLEKFALGHGVANSGCSIGGLLVPVLAGAISDYTHQHLYVFYVAASAAAVSVVSLIFLAQNSAQNKSERVSVKEIELQTMQSIQIMPKSAQYCKTAHCETSCLMSETCDSLPQNTKSRNG